MPLSAFAAVAVTLALGSLSLATNGHHSQNVTVRTPDDSVAAHVRRSRRHLRRSARSHRRGPPHSSQAGRRTESTRALQRRHLRRRHLARGLRGDGVQGRGAIRRHEGRAGVDSSVSRRGDGVGERRRRRSLDRVPAGRSAARGRHRPRGPQWPAGGPRRRRPVPAARTTNGPINLANVSGTVTARAQNGPVKFVGSTGAVDLETQNGPIGVRLDGERWTTGSLTAHAQNGPVKVEVPQNFASGVRVESSTHAPWKCRGTACESAKRSWDDGSRWIELGRGPVAVRVATVNGPVAVDWAH